MDTLYARSSPTCISRVPRRASRSSAAAAELRGYRSPSSLASLKKSTSCDSTTATSLSSRPTFVTTSSFVPAKATSTQ
eukprot:7382528-Prymnesium_polylepis.5